MKNDFVLMLLIPCLTVSLFSCKENDGKKNFEKVKSDLPNIILLVGDDQGYPYFGFMGADYVKTPNMDTLASNGLLYTNGYVPENHCRPSLQTLMTGTLPIDYNKQVNQLMGNELAKEIFTTQDTIQWKRNFQFNAMQHFKTLPKYLSEKGYKSFQGGKWWEYNYQNGGFDEGMTTGWSKEDEGKEGWFYQFMGGEGRKLARATMQPVYDFIESNSKAPFFIWYAPELPHYPFDAPEKYFCLYKDKNISESAKRYYANCTWFDDGVGELKRYLKEKGMLNNTLFIYVNDNGWEQAPEQEFRNDSLRWHNGGDKGKLSMYDQSFRTPVIFSWPNRIQPQRDTISLIHSADIPATVLDIINIKVPENYFGRSYKADLERQDFVPRKEIIGNINQLRSEEDMMGMNVEGYWIRSEKWFYSWNLTTKAERLFNIIDDPNSNYNLLEEHPEVVRQLKEKLKIWKTSKGQ